ncbi:hypothetical protein CK203_062683 [Vitis vinifera]|uniref:Uncharacterized protein n=1 Tax=Vitis vinifera TaxID=29760 RepID=A0A438FRX3_VITVI|nr:hypothetical protein CK203_062683 [Vitis vinifera]
MLEVWFNNLEDIVVEDCSEINNILSHNVPAKDANPWMRMAKRPSLVSSTDLKVMIGEADWWSALKWNKSEGLQTPNLDSVFVPIKGDTDLMTQLAEINDQLQARTQKGKPSQHPGDSSKAPSVEIETTSKQKQVA